MSDFFAPAIPAEKIMSTRLRIHMVDGDGMAPSLRGGRDYVLIAPVDTFKGDGVYLVDVWGGPTLYRVQNLLGGKIQMKLDNPLYSSVFAFTKAQFEENVLGIVAADITVRDEQMLRQLVDNGGN